MPVASVLATLPLTLTIAPATGSPLSRTVTSRELCICNSLPGCTVTIPWTSPSLIFTVQPIAPLISILPTTVSPVVSAKPLQLSQLRFSSIVSEPVLVIAHVSVANTFPPARVASSPPNTPLPVIVKLVPVGISRVEPCKKRLPPPSIVILPSAT